MMQAPAYCSHCYHIGYFKIGSLHPPGIWLTDLCVLFSLQLWFIYMIPSVIKGRGVLRDYVCRFTDMWADMEMCYSTPLESMSW